MTFVTIYSISNLPFMHNQNTNSLIIAQKYLRNLSLTSVQIHHTNSLCMKTISKCSQYTEPTSRTSNEGFAKTN